MEQRLSRDSPFATRRTTEADPNHPSSLGMKHDVLSSEVAVLDERAVHFRKSLERTRRDCPRDAVDGQRNEAGEVLQDEALTAMSRNRHGVDQECDDWTGW